MGYEALRLDIVNNVQPYLVSLDYCFIAMCAKSNVAIPISNESPESTYTFAIHSPTLKQLFISANGTAKDLSRELSKKMNEIITLKGFLCLLAEVPSGGSDWQVRLFDYLQNLARLMGLCLSNGHTVFSGFLNDLCQCLQRILETSPKLETKDRLFFTIVSPVFVETALNNKMVAQQDERVLLQAYTTFHYEILLPYKYAQYLLVIDKGSYLCNFIYDLTVASFDPRFMVIQQQLHAMRRSCYKKILTSDFLIKVHREYFLQMDEVILGDVIKQMQMLISRQTKCDESYLTSKCIASLEVIIQQCLFCPDKPGHMHLRELIDSLELLEGYGCLTITEISSDLIQKLKQWLAWQQSDSFGESRLNFHAATDSTSSSPRRAESDEHISDSASSAAIAADINAGTQRFTS